MRRFCPPIWPRDPIWPPDSTWLHHAVWRRGSSHHMPCNLDCLFLPRLWAVAARSASSRPARRPFAESRVFIEGESGLAFRTRRRVSTLAIVIALFAGPHVAISGDGAPHDLVQFRQDIETPKRSEAAERRRVEQDKKHIQELEEPSEIVEFTVGGKIVSEFSIDNNPDAPFGIAIGNFNHARGFAYLNDNKNTLTV
jgi:hypothetical protein